MLDLSPWAARFWLALLAILPFTSACSAARPLPGRRPSAVVTVPFTLTDHGSPLDYARVLHPRDCVDLLRPLTESGKVPTFASIGPEPNLEERSRDRRNRQKMRAADKTRNELLSTVRCVNPYASGTPDFERYRSQYSLYCDNHWKTGPSAAAAKAALFTAEADYKKVMQKVAADEQLASVVAKLLAPASFEKEQALRALFDRLDADDLYDRNRLFEAFIVHRNSPDSLRPLITSLVPEPELLLARWRAVEEARNEQFRQAEARWPAAFRHYYELKRLVGRYHAFAATAGGHRADLNAFCQENERAQYQDKAYAEAVGSLYAFHTEAQWLLPLQYGTTESELSAMRLYTATEYREINSGLRNLPAPALPERVRVIRDVLNSGMERMPAYTDRPVLRFSALPSAALAEHQVGSIVTYAGFTSASRKEGWAWKAGRDHSFLLYNGGSGKDVDPISSNPGEGEILFKAGTRFKVLSRKLRPGTDATFDFVMAEVDERGEVISPAARKLP